MVIFHVSLSCVSGLEKPCYVPVLKWPMVGPTGDLLVLEEHELSFYEMKFLSFKA